jgi:hypothetical protein
MVRSITPDPDRPHAIRIGFNGRRHNDFVTGVIDETYRGTIIFHSAYPIYYEQLDFGNGYVWFMTFFQTEDRQSRIELDMNGTYRNTYPPASIKSVDYSTNFIDLLLLTPSHPNGVPHISITNGEIVPQNCEVVGTPLFAPNTLTDLDIMNLRFFDVERSDYFAPTMFVSSADVKVTENGASSTFSQYFGQNDVIESNYYVTFNSSFANFNNPLFASGQAWLDYCKERV